jgi:hypothetical protein
MQFQNVQKIWYKTILRRYLCCRIETKTENTILAVRKMQNSTICLIFTEPEANNY